MRKITAYDIIVGVEHDKGESAREQILNQVQEAIAQGWEPQGGPVVDTGLRPDGSRYYGLLQALVRYSN